MNLLASIVVSIAVVHVNCQDLIVKQPVQIRCSLSGETCSGSANIPCCAGLSCTVLQALPLQQQAVYKQIIADTTADAGVCTGQISYCSRNGQICGGIGGFRCCPGYLCKGMGSNPDASGICRLGVTLEPISTAQIVSKTV